jgi:protein ImuA
VSTRHALLPVEIEEESLENRASAPEVFAAATALQPRLVEVFAESRDAAGCGFALAQLGARLETGTMLWVQDRVALRDHGRPYPHWCRTRPKSEGPSLLHIVARDAGQALWAMEEGLRCAELSAVIGEVAGNPRALDFTATRRLAVAAERFGVPALLLRLGSQADLSGARMRWRASSRPSLVPRWNPDAPGRPVWSLELFRARGARPGQWEAVHDGAADRLDLVSPLRDPALGEGERRRG